MPRTVTWWASSVDDLSPILDRWTRLSTTLGRPLSAPQWLLAWWATRPDRRWRLRILVAEEDGDLMAVVPLYGSGRLEHLRLLGQPVGLWGYGVLLHPGSSPDVVTAVVHALARARPASLQFDALDPGDASVVEKMAELWPWPGVRVVVSRREATSGLYADGTFPEWVFSRGASWRQAYKRHHRRLLEAGGIVRRASTQAELEADLETLITLHRLQWQDHSGWLTPPMEETLRTVVSTFGSGGGIRIQTVEVGGKAIFAILHAALGGRIVSVVGGFDRAYQRFGPGILAHAAGIEEAFRHGDSYVDFAWIGQRYKAQFCDTFGEVAWYTLHPRGCKDALVRGKQLMARSGTLRRIVRGVRLGRS